MGTDTTGVARPGPGRAADEEFLAGYAAGVSAGIQAGIGIGRAELITDLMPAAHAIAALRLHTRPTHTEMVTRRTTYPQPPQTADQARAQAYASWDLPEPTTHPTPDVAPDLAPDVDVICCEGA